MANLVFENIEGADRPTTMTRPKQLECDGNFPNKHEKGVNLTEDHTTSMFSEICTKPSINEVCS